MSLPVFFVVRDCTRDSALSLTIGKSNKPRHVSITDLFDDDFDIWLNRLASSRCNSDARNFCSWSIYKRDILFLSEFVERFSLSLQNGLC